MFDFNAVTPFISCPDILNTQTDNQGKTDIPFITEGIRNIKLEASPLVGRLENKKDGWNEVLPKDLLVHQIFSHCPEASPSIFLVCKSWQEALVNRPPISLLKEIIPPTECRRNLSTLPCIIIPSHTKTGDKIVQGFRVASVLQKTEKGHLEICCVPRCDTFTNHVHKTIPSWLPIVDVNQYEKQHPEFSVNKILDSENLANFIDTAHCYAKCEDDPEKISPSDLCDASACRLANCIRLDLITISQVFDQFQTVVDHASKGFKQQREELSDFVNQRLKSPNEEFNDFLQNSVNVRIEKLAVAIVESNKQKPTIN